MCRISGFWDFDFHQQYDRNEVVCRMRDTLTAGGPDDAGAWIHETEALAFGHRRLSIIDLSPLGHQPWHFEHLTLCYNGEVYNHAEVRRELENEGYSFISGSDTEVIIKAWHKWGKACLHKFRGMWAFSLWDARLRKLYLCRDRVGVKPLFWYQKNGLFLFASELKAFHKHPGFRPELNTEATAEYFQYGYITAPGCIFKHTQKLVPGHILEISENREPRIEQWWDLRDSVHKGIAEKQLWLSRDPMEVRDELEKVMQEAFSLRMVADVPVGMFLSGGIDSSLVTAVLQAQSSRPLKTFTIGFKEKAFNEADWASKVARHLGTDHTELYCTPDDARDIIPSLSDVYDEPFGDSSAIPTLLVSRLARKQVTVALSADAGDEQFFGYSYYASVLKRWEKWAGNPLYPIAGFAMRPVPPGLVQSLLSAYSGASVSAADKFIKLRNLLGIKDRILFYDTTVKLIVQDELPTLLALCPENPEKLRLERIRENLDSGFSFAQEMMMADMRSYLPDDILVKVDRATMSVALEGREPLMDHKLMELAAQMPMEYKYREGKSKWILRQILYKYIPQEWVDRPKQGFAVPVNEWFKKELKEYYNYYFDDVRIRQEGLFIPETVARMQKQYYKHQGMNAHKLWLMLNFRMWKEKYLS